MKFPNDILFDTDSFAQPATYINAAGTRKDITVVFEENFIAATPLQKPAADSTPNALIQLKDIPTPREGDTLILHDTVEELNGSGYVMDESGDTLIQENVATFTVIEAKKDADGFCLLMLTKATGVDE